MLSKEGIAEIKERLATIRDAAASFFERAQGLQDQGAECRDIWDDLHQEGEDLRSTLKRLSVDIAGAARGSPLIAEADINDIRHNTRRMLASIHFHRYRYWGVHVHHDEDVV